MTSLKHSGFTLFEVIISLGIFCTLASLAVYNLKDYQARCEEQVALAWFKNSLKSAYNQGYLKKHATKIIIDHNRIIFDTTASDNRFERHNERTLPKTLTLIGKNNYQVYSSGQSGPITWTFESSLTHHKYIYKVQMGWGEIFESKT